MRSTGLEHRLGSCGPRAELPWNLPGLGIKPVRLLNFCMNTTFMIHSPCSMDTPASPISFQSFLTLTRVFLLMFKLNLITFLLKSFQKCAIKIRKMKNSLGASLVLLLDVIGNLNQCHLLSLIPKTSAILASLLFSNSQNSVISELLPLLSSCLEALPSTFSHPSTNQARPCLASEIRQDGVCSGWYGRRLPSTF